MTTEKKGKVVFCLPTYPFKPHPATVEALKASIPLLIEAGWQEGIVSEIGNPYISAARATMLRKALDAKADVIVFIDADVSWQPDALLKLVETEGDVVAGTYRFKTNEEVKYMGNFFADDMGRPIVREDGCIKAEHVPAGFLKVTRAAINKFMNFFPELVYGEKCHPHLDLFNHGAHNGCWWGEDYSFSRRWGECGGEIWVIPNLNIDHNTADAVFKGNLHEYFLRRPGGSESDCPIPPTAKLAIPPAVAEALKRRAEAMGAI